MSRESKIFTHNSSVWGLQETVHHYESFGWELLGINGKSVSMTRETQNPNYNQLVQYEKEYEEMVEQIKILKGNVKYDNVTVNKKLALFLFLLFVFPCILYLKKKREKKQSIENYNKENQAKIDDLYLKSEQLCEKSRELFFSIQQQ